jgi:hypothetical protein
MLLPINPCYQIGFRFVTQVRGATLTLSCKLLACKLHVFLRKQAAVLHIQKSYRCYCAWKTYSELCSLDHQHEFQEKRFTMKLQQIRTLDRRFGRHKS